MQWLICCVIFIINIRTNGKASIDTLMPTLSSGYLEDITRNSENLSCYRPCKIHVKPKRCHFIFKVAPSIQEDGKANIAINDTVPGPAINVCQNDIIIIEVQNKIPDQDLAIHWHGLEQAGSPYMDGVPMITQCPIFYGQAYSYAFRASKPGTYFYHAHSVSHQSDGVFGALIVSQSSPLEPLQTHYDYDRSTENTLLISAAFPKLLTASLEDSSNIKPVELEVNGEENYKIFMIEGFSYRLRLVNAIAIDCPIIISIDDHDTTIISTDTTPVKPLKARKLLLYPGERMDVVVKANQSPAGYWLRVLGREKCEGLQVKVAVIYSGVNYTATVPLAQKISTEMNAVSFGQMLYSNNNDDTESDLSIKSYYLGIDKNKVNFKEADNDFSYISDAIPKKPFYPASLSLRSDGVVQINGKSFLYPDAPFLTQPGDVNQKAICNVGKEELHKETQCIQILQASKDETIELIMVNEGFHNNDTYTFHMHGFNMHVLATGQTVDNKPMSKEDFYKLERDGKVNRNKVNPIEKDTIILPNKGYAIVRVKLDAPGSWLLECRSCSISSLPTAILINVSQTFPKSVTDSLPKCGNYRPPDVLLN